MNERTNRSPTADRRPPTARLVKRRRGEFVIDEFKPAIRRDHVNVIGEQRLPRSDQDNRHRRASVKNMRQVAPAVRIEMNNHNEGGARLRRDNVEEILKRADSAR